MGEDEGRGRTAVVTGGTGGLGRGVTGALLDAGYRTVVTWVLEREVEAAREAFGDSLELERLDVDDPVAVGMLAERLNGEGGAWAVAHLVGGFLADRPVAEMTREEWDHQMALNARTLQTVLRAFLPGMIARGGGRVVAVGTRAALTPFAGGAAYAASKAAVIALVRAVSEEAKHDGVGVNCILPSVIDTPANRAAMPDADHARWVAPADIGAVVRFLCSDASRAVTGAAIPVFGRA